ncbi:hypothetical protein AWB71_00781 [Caballeronia peredens]|nr:hypothetical protein AWB71_00781 [Caballeronia peredens]
MWWSGEAFDASTKAVARPRAGDALWMTARLGMCSTACDALQVMPALRDVPVGRSPSSCVGQGSSARRSAKATDEPIS